MKVMDIEEVAKIAQEQIDKENAGNPSIKKMMKEERIRLLNDKKQPVY